MSDELKLSDDGMFHGIPRNTNSVPCRCGGFCDEVGVTKAENKEHGCGRDRVCCVKAFKCRICDERYLATLEAPEMY